MIIAKQINRFISFLYSIYKQSIVTTKFRIEEIDLKSHTVIIHRMGSHSVFRLPIAEVMCDADIISNLPSEQACWLGFYSGKICIKSMQEKYKNNDFFIRSAQGNFKIASQDRRGNIIYLNEKTNKLFSASPIDICENEIIIKQFDPSQACYIGVLAGKSVDKNTGKENTYKPKVPNLVLVK